jgi:hypothetical protein
MKIPFFAGCFISDWDAFTSPADYTLTSELISRDFGISANLIAQLDDSLLQGKELMAWLVYDKNDKKLQFKTTIPAK